MEKAITERIKNREIIVKGEGGGGGERAERLYDQLAIAQLSPRSSWAVGLAERFQIKSMRGWCGCDQVARSSTALTR